MQGGVTRQLSVDEYPRATAVHFDLPALRDGVASTKKRYTVVHLTSLTLSVMNAIKPDFFRDRGIRKVRVVPGALTISATCRLLCELA